MATCTNLEPAPSKPQAVEMSTSDQVGDDDGHRNPPDPIEPPLSEMGTYDAIGDVCDAPSSNGHQAQAAPGRICPQCDHPTKNLYGIDDDNRVSGSRAYTAAVRSILMVADDPNHEGDRLLFAQGNLAPSSGGQRYGIEGRPAELDDGTIQDHPAIVWRGESSTTLAEALARTDRPESDPRPGEQADQFLTEALAEGRVLASEIKAMAADEDISKNTLDRAKQRLGVESHREGFGKGSKVWWSLADGDVHKSRTGALEPQAVEMSTSDQVGDHDGHRTPPDPIEPHLSEMGTYDAIGDVCGAPSSNGHQAQAARGRICPQCDRPTKNLYGIDDDNRVCIECWYENRNATS